MQRTRSKPRSAPVGGASWPLPQLREVLTPGSGSRSSGPGQCESLPGDSKASSVLRSSGHVGARVSHPGNPGCQVEGTSLLPGLRLQRKSTEKPNQSESGACVTPGVDSVPLVPVSHGDQKLALQLSGQAPSRAAEKTEKNQQANGPVPEITRLQRKGTQGHKSKI